jgi:hypothetical protein
VALVRTNVSEELSAPQMIYLRSVLRLLVTANVVPSSPILVTLIMDAILFSETSVLTRATRRNIPADGNSVIPPVDLHYKKTPAAEVSRSILVPLGLPRPSNGTLYSESESQWR